MGTWPLHGQRRPWPAGQRLGAASPPHRQRRCCCPGRWPAVDRHAGDAVEGSVRPARGQRVAPVRQGARKGLFPPKRLQHTPPAMRHWRAGRRISKGSSALAATQLADGPAQSIGPKSMANEPGPTPPHFGLVMARAWCSLAPLQAGPDAAAAMSKESLRPIQPGRSSAFRRPFTPGACSRLHRGGSPAQRCTAEAASRAASSSSSSRADGADVPSSRRRRCQGLSCVHTEAQLATTGTPALWRWG